MTQKLLTLDKYKENIVNFLDLFLSEQERNIAKINLEDKVFYTLKNFLWRGKMIRGNLLLLSYEILQNNLSNSYEILQNNSSNLSLKKILPFAGALELIQAGLLIHDDIIDQDQQRRGQDSIWQYYASLNAHYDQHYGKSQAICVGDLAFFLANQLIVQGCANLNSSEKQSDEPNNNQANKELSSKQQSLEIQQLLNKEISQVILAEMLDVQMAQNKKTPSLEQIEEMNLYKTARYTFSLPLILAGHLAEQSPAIIKNLSEIGEKIGLIFQMRDDYLGIFGDNKKTGKPILSDIREGKKTIFYYYLIKNKQLNAKEKKLLKKCFAVEQISHQNSVALQKLFKKYSLQTVSQQIKKLEHKTLDIIESLNNEKLEALLIEILNFTQNRQH